MGFETECASHIETMVWPSIVGASDIHSYSPDKLIEDISQ